MRSMTVGDSNKESETERHWNCNRFKPNITARQAKQLLAKDTTQAIELRHNALF